MGAEAIYWVLEALKKRRPGNEVMLYVGDERPYGRIVGLTADAVTLEPRTSAPPAERTIAALSAVQMVKELS